MDEASMIVKVGIADMKTAAPPHVIRTSGLGSCVGVVIYDMQRSIAGMAHVMLPDSSLSRGGDLNIAKFADTAVPELRKLLLAQGASAAALKAKIAGGAQMFQYTGGTDLMRIGPRNVEAVKQQLIQLGIPLVAEDTGGNSGRTIEFNGAAGSLSIRTVNKGTNII